MDTISEEGEVKGKTHDLFKLCDREGKGFVTSDDLKNLQEDLALTSEQIEVVFGQLDRNGDGFLTVEEFENGLELFMTASLNSPTKKNVDDCDQNIESTLIHINDIDEHADQGNGSKNSIDPDGSDSTSTTYSNFKPTGFLQEIAHVELWSQIQNQHPELLPLFEDFLQNLSEKHEQILNETEILKQSFYKKTTEYEHQINVLYEEMESQIKEEREAILSQKLEIESQLRQELDETVEMKDQDVQELLSKWLQTSTQLKELRETKMATENENQQLLKDKELLELQLDTYKQNLQELHKKLDEFKTSNVKAKREQFWSINRRLQDENDELDDVLHADVPKQLPREILAKRGSILSDYFCESKSHAASMPSSQDEACKNEESGPDVWTPQMSTQVNQSNPFLINSEETVRFLAATNPFIEDIKRNKDNRSTYKSFSDPDLDNFETVSAPYENVSEAGSSDRKIPALCLIHPNNHQVNGISSESEIQKDDETPKSSFTEDVNGNLEEAEVNNETVTSAGGAVGLAKNEPKSSAISNPGQLPESLFKVVFIGDSGVGKTSLINRICGGTFQEKFSATIGVDFRVRNVAIDGHHVVLQLWDTAGQERFRSITTQYLRKSDGVLIAYDATSEPSFRNVSSWIASIEGVQNENVVVALLGNKSDLAATNKVIPFEDGQRLASDRDLLFFETSAKDGTGIEELVSAMARKLKIQQKKDLESCVQLLKPAAPVITKKMCC